MGGGYRGTGQGGTPTVEVLVEEVEVKKGMGVSVWGGNTPHVSLLPSFNATTCLWTD